MDKKTIKINQKSHSDLQKLDERDRLNQPKKEEETKSVEQEMNEARANIKRSQKK